MYFDKDHLDERMLLNEQKKSNPQPEFFSRKSSVKQRGARQSSQSVFSKAGRRQKSKPASEFLNDEPHEKSLNSQLKKFTKTHGVNFNCSTVYTHSAVTVKDNERNLVLFQTQVGSGQKIVDYSTFRDNKDKSLDMLEEVKDVLPGPFFNLVETEMPEDKDRQIRSLETRRVHQDYKEAFFSQQQKFVCLRNSTTNDIDVFWCGGAKRSFFQREETLAKGCKEFLFSQSGAQECDVVFSANDRYMAVVQDKLLVVSELRANPRQDSDFSRSSINDDRMLRDDFLVEDYRNVDLHSFTLDNDTYSSIVRVHLSEDIDLTKTTWVVLQSDLFETLHFIVLCDLLPDDPFRRSIKEEGDSQLLVRPEDVNTGIMASNITKSTLGMNFYPNPTAGRLVNFVELANDSFQEIIFQRDGRMAFIQTDQLVVKLDFYLDPNNSMNNRIDLQTVPLADHIDVSLFKLGLEDMVFCKVDHGSGLVTLTTHNTENQSAFTESQFEISGNIQIVEMHESNESLMEPFLRMIGIRDNEEVLVWELKTLDDGLLRSQKIFNRSDRACFRWPFYAHTISNSEIIINYLTIKEVGIRLALPEEEAEHYYIHRMCFSNSVDLYILCLEKIKDEEEDERSFKIFRVSVGQDTSIERLNLSKTGALKNVPNVPAITTLRQTSAIMQMSVGKSPFERAIGPVQICFRGQLRNFPKDSAEIFAIEHRINLLKKIAILSFNGSAIHLVPLDQSQDRPSDVIRSQNSAYKILRLSNDQFMCVDATQHKLIRVFVKYGPNGFDLHESIVYQDYSVKIVNFLGEKEKLYLMVDDKLEVKIKVLSFDKSMTNLKVQMSYGEDFDLPNDSQFINAFAEAKFMASGCLIVNDWRLTKVSQINENQPAIFQDYFHFLPEDDSDAYERCLLISQSKASMYHRRQALVFNYPESRKPKQIQVQPFYDDNKVSLSHKKGQVCWIDLDAKLGGVKRIFQFMPSRWKLYEYDTSGLLRKVSDYKNEMTNLKILACSPKEPIYLVSPYGPDYISKLQIKQITGESQSKLLASFDLRDVKLYVKEKNTFFGKSTKEVDILEMIEEQKNVLGCKLDFKINSKGDIALATVMPSGYIKCVYLLQKIISKSESNEQKSMGEDTFIAVEVIPKRKPEDVALDQRFQGNINLDESTKSLHKSQNTSVPDLYGQAIEQCRNFNFVKKFSLSDENLLLWNKKVILHGKIDKLESDKVIRVNKLLLEIATLSDCLSLESRKKKMERVLTEKGSADSRENLRKNQAKNTSDDYFELVECHDIKISNKDSEPPSTTLQVKIITGNNSSHIMMYNLDKEREVTFIGASKNAQMFYSENGVYVWDEQLGIINLEDKQPLLEYHALDKNIASMDLEHVEYGVAWGNRLTQTSDEELLIFANNILLPYSYFNIIQRFRTQSQDRERKAFFVQDFCKIEGANNLHKCKYDPAQIEKILDCYWKQNPMYVLAVLINEEASGSSDKSKSNQLTNSSIQRRQSRSVNELNQSDENKDVLEVQIDISSYRLINKILFYLSKLPSQLSFYDLMPKFNKLTGFSFFNAYLDTWLQQTSQMEQTQVLFTSMQKGCHHVTNESSYLDKDFFQKYPVENVRPKLEGTNNTALLEYQKKFKDANMHQVTIQMVQVSWMKDNDVTKNFFEALINAGNLDLFKNRNMVELIRYMWDISRVYFIWYRFVPFLLFLYLPLNVFVFIPLAKSEHKTLNIVQLVCLACTAVYLLTQLYSQLNDMCMLGIRGYVTSFSSMYNLIVIASLGSFVYYAAQIVVSQLDSDNVTQEFIETLRCIEIAAILILNLQLFRFLKIFEFFQSFIRQFLEIMKSTAQIASMLMFVIITQAIVIWVLDENSIEPVYRNNTIKGFFRAFLDSYKLAIGDFEPVQDAFVGNTEYDWLFWVIFFIGTVLSLILLLNMVIAVMSMSLETVVQDQEALVNREKLIDIITNLHRMPSRVRRQFKENKYLFVVEVDPQFDLDEHKQSEAENVEEQAAQERQQAAMQAQLELFQAQMLTMMADSDSKRQQNTVGAPGGMDSNAAGQLQLPSQQRQFDRISTIGDMPRGKMGYQ